MKYYKRRLQCNLNLMAGRLRRNGVLYVAGGLAFEGSWRKRRGVFRLGAVSQTHQWGYN